MPYHPAYFVLRRYTNSLVPLLFTFLLALLITACDDDDSHYTLTVNSTEHGSVNVSPEATDYLAGTQVTVTATPEQGYVFTGWSGDHPSENPLTLEIDGDQSIQANFELGVTINLSEAEHGQVIIDPPIESGTVVPFGSQFTITALPDNGYAIDSIYKMIWVVGTWSAYLDESTSSPHTIVTDKQDARFKIYGGDLDSYTIGASFIPDDTWQDLQITEDVIYATPGSKALKYDVYTPPGAVDLPIVVIVHGGGWSLNSEDIMRGQARYIAESGRYVVASIDYRLLVDLDEPAPTHADMIEDVYGAIAHIQENAAVYGGDASRVIITGDSAGGHLSASAGLLTPYIGSQGYTGEIGQSYFMPSYIPSSMSVEQLQQQISNSLLAVAPSYGAFNRTDGVGDMDPAVEPISNIPSSNQRLLPPFYLQVGSDDTTVGPEGVRQFAQALEDAGQQVEFVEYPGVGHAYFDWKPEAGARETFNTVGKPALDDMIAFFDAVVASNN